MKPENTFTKKDIVVGLFCLAFLLMNLGAIGSAGRQKAMESVCLSNLKQWGCAFNMWLNDHDGTFMRGNTTGTQTPDKWVMCLAPYYGGILRTTEIPREFKIRFCPSAMSFAKEGAKQPFAAWQIQAMKGDPDPYLNYYWDGSYGSNSWIYDSTNLVTIPGGKTDGNWHNANVKGTSQIPLLLDSAFFGGFPKEDDAHPEVSGDVVNAQRAGYYMKQFCIDRHNGSVNALFMDFSVRPVGLKELWTLKWHRNYNTCGQWTKCGGADPNDWPEWMRVFKDY